MTKMGGETAFKADQGSRASRAGGQSSGQFRLTLEVLKSGRDVQGGTVRRRRTKFRSHRQAPLAENRPVKAKQQRLLRFGPPHGRRQGG